VAAPGGRVTGPTPATAADAPDVIALLARIWEEYGFIWDPVTEFPDVFRFDAHYAPPHGAFWIMRDEAARLVGSIGVERVDATTAEIRRLYLDARLRGRGLGRTLVEEVLAWCRAHDLIRLVLWSDTRFEHSHRLYTRMGFAQLGERTVPNDLNASREYRFERDV
jgi:RimJ/RimL family protein N-acetyltransferase